MFGILWKITERDFNDPTFPKHIGVDPNNWIFSNDFFVILKKYHNFSPEQVDASNSPTKSSFSFTDFELGLELIYDSSTKATYFSPLSSFTFLS